jgi:hypothetical protein
MRAFKEVNQNTVAILLTMDILFLGQREAGAHADYQHRSDEIGYRAHADSRNSLSTSKLKIHALP